MTTKKSSERTRAGKSITDDLIAKLVGRAESGFDVDEIIRRRGGRPPMGSAAAAVESVRLEPEVSQLLHERAERDGRTHSDVIRDALREYSRAS